MINLNPFHIHKYEIIECNLTYVYQCKCGNQFEVIKEDKRREEMTFTDIELNEFRKYITEEIGSWCPENYKMFAEIANMPIWQRELFLWQYKQKVKEQMRILRSKCTIVGKLINIHNYFNIAEKELGLK